MNLEKFKDLNVLVTGADGFIPSYVCDRLVELGANVTALTRRTSSNQLKAISHLVDKVKFRWGDITDLSLLVFETKDTDVIYHLGAQSHVQYSLHNPLETYQTNTIGTLNVLEAARINDVERVVHAGSAEVYGKPEAVPITEEHKLAPRSPYAAGKQVFAYTDQYSTPTLVDDLVDCIIKIIKSDTAGIYHIVGSSCINRYEFAKILARKFDLSEKLVIPTTTRERPQIAKRPTISCLNNSKASKEFEMHYSTVEEGLNRVLQQSIDSN